MGDERPGWRRALALGWLLLGLLLPGLTAAEEPRSEPAAPGGALARIQSAGVLRVAIDATYPPMVTTQGRNIRTEQELAGQRVAVQTNTTSQRWVEQLRQRGVAVREVRPFPGAPECFAAVKSGQADVIVIDEPVGRFFSRRDSSFVITGQALEPEPIGIAINTEDKELSAAAHAHRHGLPALQPVPPHDDPGQRH